MTAHEGYRCGRRWTPVRVWWLGLSLTRQFMVGGSAVVLAGMLVIGTWVSSKIEEGVRHGAATEAALYLDSIVAPHLQSLAERTTLPAVSKTALNELLTQDIIRSHVTAVKVWLRGGTIVYSTRKELLGQTFQPGADLREAFRGEVVSRLGTLSTAENRSERAVGVPLLKIYSPIWDESKSEIIAVAEFYRNAEGLDRELARARHDSWLMTVIVVLLMAISLYGIIARGSRTIATQRVALTEKIAQISDTLRSNEELRGRVERSALVAAENNERFLRRIGADLHDGPAQLVSLALLRLDAWKPPPGSGVGATELTDIRSSLSSALEDVRNICAGLLLPEIDKLSLAEAVEFAVRDHERRTGTKVEVCTEDLPVAVPYSVKVCLCRFLQEGLNNAFRHAAGKGQRVSARHDAGVLSAEVSDQGPGIGRPPSTGESCRLGLTGLWDRIENLGGTLEVISRPGQGTRLVARLPL